MLAPSPPPGPGPSRPAALFIYKRASSNYLEQATTQFKLS